MGSEPQRHRDRTGQENARTVLRVAICISAFALVSSAFAQLPVRNYWGERVEWHSARDLAFAGMGMVEPGPAALFDNPAQLGFARRPGLELTYGLGLGFEQRTRVVYDQFENAIGEAVFADNTSAAGIPGPLAVSYPLPGRVVVAAGAAPAIDFHYRYRKEYRDDYYVLIGEDRVRQEGTVFEAGLGAGFRPLEWLSVGGTGVYLFGTRELEAYEIRLPDTSRFSESGKPAGVGYRAGIAARPLSRLECGLGFTGPVKLSDWRSGQDEADARLPWQATLALGYQAPGTLPARMMAEARYCAWNSVDTTHSNVLSVRAGVEHQMLNFVRLRYGFGIEPSRFDPTVQLIGAGAGVGLDAGPFLVDIGALFRREAVSPRFYQGEPPPADLRIYQTGAILAVTLSREF